MAEEYLYHLAKWNERNKSLTCPQCHRGRGCYKEYVSAYGVPLDPDGHLVGKCDHTNTCGYHLTPGEWFKMNPDARKQLPSQLKVEVPDRKPILIDRDIAVRTMTEYDHNQFARWLYTLPSGWRKEDIDKLLRWYGVGTMRDERCIFWQIAKDLTFRSGKVMQYEANGHRSKDEEGNPVGMTWIHSIMQRQGYFPSKEYELRQCLFGEHLLNAFEGVSVHIVESEKTAILMAMLDTNSTFMVRNDWHGKHLWMACGGMYNLQGTRLIPLKGHPIICYPDTNGVARWKETLKNQPDIKVETSWMAELNDQDPKGADIGDLALRQMYEQHQPIRENPQVKYLIDKLDLHET